MSNFFKITSVKKYFLLRFYSIFYDSSEGDIKSGVIKIMHFLCRLKN